MECRAFVDLIVVAELAELRGEGSTAVAEHVRTCAPCAQRARLMLDATAVLSWTLGEGGLREREAVGVRRVLEMGRLAPGAGARAGSRTGGGDGIAWRPRRRFGLAPLLAAAAVVLAIGLRIMGGDGDGLGWPDLNTGSATQAADEFGAGLEAPGVELPPGRNAVVFRTSNPKITVVWYYSSQGGP